MPVDALTNAVVPEPVTVYVPDPVIDLEALPSSLTNVALCTLYTEQANVPCARVRAPLTVSAALRVAVPALLTPNPARVFPLLVIVPVLLIVALNEVYVPPLDNVMVFTFTEVVPGSNEVVPKYSVLNQLPVVSVATLAPVVNVKFGALVVVPPAVLPQVNVLGVDMSGTVNPPGPVRVNPVRVAIVNASVFIFPGLALPNAIERVVELLELNPATVNVTPSANVNVPAVNVYVPVNE